MKQLLSDIKQCKLCLPYLKDGVNPVISAHKQSRIAIIGQAPGLRVHNTSIPWNDKSGERLREWMGVTDTQFYDPKLFAIIPMGFCYPGKGKSGDLPPRKECAPKWHQPLFDELSNLQLILLIGSYAQNYYLTDAKRTLTDTVMHFEEYLPTHFVLPHPSPRNNIWLKKNSWFESLLLPTLKEQVTQIIQ